MKSDIEALRQALAAGPTPGPWVDDRHASWAHPITTVNAPDRKPLRDVVAYVRLSDVANFSCTIGKAEQEWKNAAYIAAASPDRIARLLDALELAQRDAERLNWLDENPDSIGRSQGYRGSACSWTARDGDGYLHDFTSAREAIDAAMKEHP